MPNKEEMEGIYMRDFGAVKVICRVITLIEFIAFMFAAYMMPEFMDQGIFADVKEQTRYILVGLGIALVVMMIVSLIVKYTMKDASKVAPYRIVDVITRLVFTMPAGLVIMYYLEDAKGYEDLICAIVGTCIFIVMNAVLKFTLQETMSVSFMRSDSL